MELEMPQESKMKAKETSKEKDQERKKRKENKVKKRVRWSLAQAGKEESGCRVQGNQRWQLVEVEWSGHWRLCSRKWTRS